MSDKKENSNSALMDGQSVSLELSDGSTLEFTITDKDYIKVINNIGKNANQIQHNFLVGTVHKESKDTLMSLITDSAATTIELFGEVFELYEPRVKVISKKLNKKRAI